MYTVLYTLLANVLHFGTECTAFWYTMVRISLYSCILQQKAIYSDKEYTDILIQNVICCFIICWILIQNVLDSATWATRYRTLQYSGCNVIFYELFSTMYRILLYTQFCFSPILLCGVLFCVYSANALGIFCHPLYSAILRSTTGTERTVFQFNSAMKKAPQLCVDAVQMLFWVSLERKVEDYVLC